MYDSSAFKAKHLATRQKRCYTENCLERKKEAIE